jgi:PAS domain S-box-containing protein
MDQEFSQQIEAAQNQLYQLLDQVGQLPPDEREVAEEAVEALSHSLEKLHEAEEELRQQNEELAATRQALEEERQRYQQLFTFAPDGYLVTDARGIIREANRAAAELFGVQREHLEGKPLGLFVAEGERAAFHARLSRMRAREEARRASWKTRMQSRSDAPFYAALTTSPIPNEVGELSGIRWLVRDITPRVEVEEALRDAFTEAQRRESETRWLLSASQAVMECHTFEEAARRIFDVAREATGAVSGYVAMISEDGKQNDLLFLETGGLPCKVDSDLPMPIRGLRMEAYEKAEVVYHNDFEYSKWKKFIPPKHVEMHNVLFAPLIIQNRAVGVIGLANKPTDFTEDDAKMAKAFGDMAAMALRRVQAEEALRESREQYRVLFESFPLGITVSDSSGQILEVNAESEHLLGISRGEHPMRHRDGEEWQIIRPDGSPMPDEEYAGVRALQESRVIENVELGITRLDGEITWLSVTAAPLKDDRVVITYNDITERKKAERELRRLAAVVDMSPDGIAITDMEGEIIYTNPAMASLYGLDRAEEAIGTDSSEWFVSPDEARTAMHETLEKGSITNREFEILNEHGESVPVEISVTVLWDESDKPTRFATITRDITERKRMEAVILEERERLSSILAALETGLSLINPDMTIAWVNRKVHEMFPGGEPVGQICHRFYERRETPCEQCGTQTAFQTGEVQIHDRWNSITERWYTIISQPILDERGNVVNVLEGVTDITERKQAEEEIESERAFLAAVLDNIEEAVVICDEEGRITRFNEAARRLHGLPERPISPDQWAEYYNLYREDGTTPLSTEEIPLFRALQGERVRNAEIVVDSKHGEPRSLVCNGQPLIDEPGQVTGAVVTMHDITGRKQMEEALRESKALFKGLTDNSFDLMNILNADATIRYENYATKRILGYEAGARVGQSALEFVHPEDRREVQEGFQQLVATPGGSAVGEFRFRHEDGSWVWLETNGQNFLHDPDLQGILINSRDITERKRVESVTAARLRIAAEAPRKSSKELMQTALDEIEDLTNSKIGFYHFLLDDQETIALQTWSTNTLENMCNVKGEGRHYSISEAGVWVDAIHEQRPIIHNDYQTIPHRKGTPPGHAPVIRELVYPIIRNERIEAIIGVGNKPSDYNETDLESVSLLSDFSWEIIERKRAEEKLEQYAADLERSNEELEQFAYVISHDLREPARMVKGYLELLEDRYQGKLDEKGDKFIHYAVDGAERMQEMVKALLDLSRVGTRGKDPAPTDAEAVLERTLRVLGQAIEEYEAEVTYDPLPTVIADEAQLARVFQNLIANAIKFRREDVPPRVHVAAQQKDDEWLLSVADNGIGIDPDQAERIFQIFQRLHTRDEYEGLGMGLALCKRIVERHGGRIWVESDPGEGSTFYFTLPAQETEPMVG